MDNVKNVFRCYSLNCKIPGVRKYGHTFIEWPKKFNVLYTFEELRKLVWNFSHPSTKKKLFNLPKLVRPGKADKKAKQFLDEIATRREEFQKFSQPLVPFKVTTWTKENIVFGDEISIDLMFLKGKAVLHVVNAPTRSSAGTFLDSRGMRFGQWVEGFWDAFVMTWCLLHTGYPNRLRTDQESAFTLDRWR